jgi:integrase
MISKPRLFGQVKQADGKHKWVFVTAAANGRFKPVKGANRYYIRFTASDGRRKVLPAGGSLETALVALRRVEVGIRAGITPDQGKSSDISRLTVAAASAAYLDKVRTLRSEGTLGAYTTAVRAFLDNCPKTYLDEITQDDVLSHVNWLRDTCVRRKIGSQDTTIRNRLLFLSTFFISSGFAFPLPRKDWPRKPAHNPEKYSQDDIKTFLTEADQDEKDLLEFFLYTGFRDGEVAHAYFTDIDFKKGSINVTDKVEFNWRIKDRERRPFDIPLPPPFVARMKARRDERKTRLIFPNGKGGPDIHLIRVVQAVAKRIADRTGEPVGRVTNHKFRKTFGSIMARQYGVKTAQMFLGHSDLKTTSLYLSADEDELAEVRKNAANTFRDYTA